MRSLRPHLPGPLRRVPQHRRRQYPTAAKRSPPGLLRQIAERGNGVFQEFNDGDIQNLGLGALDYSSLASPQRDEDAAGAGAPLGARPTAAAGGHRRRRPARTTSTTTSPTRPTRSSADSRRRLLRRQLRGAPRRTTASTPATCKDARGCDPASPLTWAACCRDTDGDGLTQFAEAFLETRRGLVDTTATASPTGSRRATGSTRSAPTAGDLDTDGDGIPDDARVPRRHRPHPPDRDLYDSDGYQYEIVAEPQANGCICYDYAVTNIRMVTPPQHARACGRATTSSSCGSPRRRRAASPPTTASGGPPAPAAQYAPPGDPRAGRARDLSCQRQPTSSRRNDARRPDAELRDRLRGGRP